MNLNHYKNKSCRLCRKSELISVLKLQSTPPANAFIKKENLKSPQKEFPLEIFFCSGCSHIQLLDVVNPSLLFEDYVYVSGTSNVFVNHFKNYAEKILGQFKPKKEFLIVDIGSNDGTLLSFFKDNGYEVLGVDPAKKISNNASESGINTITNFFTYELAKTIKSNFRQASVITANNVFAHADNLKDIIMGIKELLSADGIFVFEVSYLVDVLEKNLFDTIYHEHLSYHSVKPLEKFFLEHDLELFSVERVNTHGGSIRGYVQLKGSSRKKDGSVDQLINYENSIGLSDPQTFFKFSRNINKLKTNLLQLLENIKSNNKKIAGFGAPAKATTLMYEFGITKKYIDFIVDDSPLKQGLFSPGLKIPVLPTNSIDLQKPDYLLILAWNFAESIVNKNKEFLNSGGKFIIPLPELKIIEK